MRFAEKIWRCIRGFARVTVAPGDREGFFNLCAEEGLLLTEPRAGDGTVTVTLSPEELGELLALEEKGGFSVLSVEKRGGGFILPFLKRRWGLFLGAAAAVLLAVLSSFFIWQIEIVGADAALSARIMGALSDCGVTVGSWAVGLSVPEVQNELLLRLPDLAWITVNVKGSRAWVLFREKTLPPEILSLSEPSDIRARQAGVITETIVLRGVPEVSAGDTVAAGDLLIAGSPAAQGAVFARTWYEISASMPLDCRAKVYTGRENTLWRLIFSEKRADLFFYSGNTYGSCDKIREIRLVTLPDGAVLPLGLEKLSLREYETVPAQIPRDAAEGLLRAELLEQLDARCRGSVAKAEFYSSLNEGLLTVTLKAECLEDIALRQ
ncbi:MAG: sporulation protein YqfD [Oscillospiraceae bacterium]|nr:sporulation protein YqfD [Oscillospiraceae bacterium]